MARTTRRRLLGAGATGLLAAIAGCSSLTPFVGKRIEDERTVAADDGDAVTVGTDVGDVTVQTAAREDVAIEAVKQSSSATADLSELELSTERTDGRLRVQGEWNGESSTVGGQPSMDLTVVVPESVTVDRVATDVGDVEVRDVTGDLTVEAGTGDVTVERVDGRVDARTSTGDVTLRSIGVLGTVRTGTGDADVEVPAVEGDTTVRSEVGDLTARLAPDLDVDLVARSNVGDVSVGNLSLRTDRATEREVVGTLGDGGPTLTLATGTGDVSVRAL